MASDDGESPRVQQRGTSRLAMFMGGLLCFLTGTLFQNTQVTTIFNPQQMPHFPQPQSPDSSNANSAIAVDTQTSGTLEKFHGRLKSLHKMSADGHLEHRKALAAHTETQEQELLKIRKDTQTKLDRVSQQAQDSQKAVASAEEQVAQLKQELKEISKHYGGEIQKIKEELMNAKSSSSSQATKTTTPSKTEDQVPASKEEPVIPKKTAAKATPIASPNNKPKIVIDTSPPPTNIKYPQTTKTPFGTYTTHSPYAYVLMNWKVNPHKSTKYRAYITNMLLTAKVLRQHGSKADIVAIFRMDNVVIDETLPKSDEDLLRAMNIQIRYLPREEPDFNSRRDTKYFHKFHTYGMVEYRRVLVLDGDLIPVTNLDYLFELSDNGPNSVLKPYVVVAGIHEPSNGGFFMATPHMDAYNRAQELIREKWETAGLIHKFDRVNGWGHPFLGEEKWENNKESGQRWDFLGAWCDQGLHFHMMMYEIQSVTQILARKIIHWGPSPNGNGTTIAENVITMKEREESPLYQYSKQPYGWMPTECDKWTFKRNKGSWAGCTPPYSDFEHFSGKSKVWNLLVPDDLWQDKLGEPQDSRHLWWQLLYQLKVDDGLDIQPLLTAINETRDWDAELLSGPPKGRKGRKRKGGAASKKL